MSPFLILAAVAVRGIVLAPDAGGRGQLCPIGPDMAYTAAHVVQGSVIGSWQTEAASGMLEIVSMDVEADLAIVQTTRGHFPFWYARAGEPKVGEALSASGWNVWAKGWYISTGVYYGIDDEDEMAMSTPLHFGMSGGCILNERDEAVGIVKGFFANHQGPFTVSYGKPLWKLPKKLKEGK